MKNPKIMISVTVFVWSFGAFLGRLIAIRSQFLFLGMSFSFSLLTLSVYYLWQRRGSVAAKGRVWKPRYALVGLFGYFIYHLSLNQSFRAFDSASETVVLNYTWPLFTVVFTRCLFTRKALDGGTRAVEWAGILAGFGSVVLVATGGDIGSLSLTNAPGVGWGLLAGTSYGFFSAYSSTIPEEGHGAFLLSAITASWILMLGPSLSETSLLTSITVNDLLLVGALGCVADGIGYITWTRANRLAREAGISVSSIASPTLALPLLNLVWVSALLKEVAVLRADFAVSLLLIVLSCVLCQKAGAICQVISGSRRSRRE